MSEPTGSTDCSWIMAVVREHEGPLVRYAARITGDLERARDVVQETFLRLCNERRVDVEAHLAQWLFTVCRTKSLDVRRKEKRMKLIADTVTTDTPALPKSASGDPLEQQETTGRIIELLDRLPANQQEVVRLRFQNGLSYKDISAVTGLSVTNVGYLLHTAITSLRRQITRPGVQSQSQE